MVSHGLKFSVKLPTEPLNRVTLVVPPDFELVPLVVQPVSASAAAATRATTATVVLPLDRRDIIDPSFVVVGKGNATNVNTLTSSSRSAKTFFRGLYKVCQVSSMVSYVTVA